MKWGIATQEEAGHISEEFDMKNKNLPVRSNSMGNKV